MNGGILGGVLIYRFGGNRAGRVIKTKIFF
jgi:hypothetical protein